VGDGTGRDALADVGAVVTGAVPTTAVPSLLATAQIGLCPYPADAPNYFSPLKLFEYLAAGLPVVAAALPGVVDVAGHVAMCVPPGDADALAGAVVALARDPARRAQLGAAGRRLILASHTWAHRARGLLALAADLDPMARPA
jgi:glycosyltransferase involved in cell wall biosynthesis